MIDAFWNIRRNGSLNCLVKQSRAYNFTDSKRELGEGWEQWLPSALQQIGRLRPGWASPVPSFSATYPICFFPSTKQACLFSEGKMRRDRWQLIEKQQFAFDKGALLKKNFFEVWIFKKIKIIKWSCHPNQYTYIHTYSMRACACARTHTHTHTYTHTYIHARTHMEKPKPCMSQEQ